MYVVAFLFTLLYFAIAWWNLLLSIHGARSLPIVALLYLAVSIALTWLAARRLRRGSSDPTARWIALVIVGLGLSAAGASLWFVTVEAEIALEKRKQAAVEVEWTEESVFHSRKGNPIGLKLVFHARVPHDDWYHFRAPGLGTSAETSRTLGRNFSGAWPGHALGLRTYREEVTPALEKPGWFRESTDYTLTYYVVPAYVVDAATTPMPCIWVPENFPADQWEALLGSEFAGTYRFSPIIGAYDPDFETRGRYSQKLFFDGIRKENVSFCPPAGRSPGHLSAFPGIF